MKIKKTLYNWLTNSFLLIIRNEENFAEKRTISFNYAKLIVLGFTFFIAIFLLCLYLLYSPLFRWLNPEYQELEKDKKIISLSFQVDSLLKDGQRKDIYSKHLMKILRGENFLSDTSNNTDNINSARQDVNLDNLSSVDKELRKEIEEENGVVLAINPDLGNNSGNYYIRPVEGILEQKYDYKRDFLGVDIVTKPKETVKSIADGMVIFSNLGETGYIIALQHKNGLISLYKNNSVLLKQTGEYVKAGDPIGLVGNKDNTGEKYRLHFEIWQDGNSVNPENFISF